MPQPWRLSSRAPHHPPAAACSTMQAATLRGRDVAPAQPCWASSVAKNSLAFASCPQVQEVCQLVCLRSARLCAAAITGMLQRVGHPCGSRAAGGSGSAGPAPPVVVAVDGSVFEKYDKFR